jgi:predicted metal-binding membrane protein
VWTTPITLIDVYLTAYIFILMLYGCGEVRYLLPVVPFVLAYAWAGIKALPFTVPRWCVIGYLALFIGFGTIALANEWTIALIDREQSYRAFDEIVRVFQDRILRGSESF